MAAAPPALRRLSPAPTALSPAIWAAACAGDVAQVAALYEAEGYTHIDARSTYQSTLLHAAARHGHVRLAADLLAKRADVNAIDFGGMRRQPLHWACRSGSVEMVELLVAAGADTKVGWAWCCTQCWVRGTALQGRLHAAAARLCCLGRSACRLHAAGQ